MNNPTPTAFPMHAAQFEIYPREGAAFTHLAPLLTGLDCLDFMVQVVDPAANQGQITSKFDSALEAKLLSLGATSLNLALPDIRQQVDFTFSFKGKKVAVESEKANREKILRDFLKCHMYFHAGADFALVVLPKNWAHRKGVWDLFDFGVQRFAECRKFGFGTDDKFSRILLLGYTQSEAATGQPLSQKTRNAMRNAAALPK